MTGFKRSNAAAFVAMTALSGWLWAVPAQASIITVDWDVVPHEEGLLEVTPYYSCGGANYGNRLCQYLWQQGMELSAVNFSFYDDKFMDGFGLAVPESEIPFGGVQEIGPRCEAALAPCFDEFTPVEMELSGFGFPGDPPNLFIVSSRGGVLKFPSLEGRQSIDFGGGQWERLHWLQVGFYLPAACEDAVPPEDINCSPSREWGLEVDSLTFRPVPEPATLALMATGMLGWIGRRRSARRSR